MKWFVTSTRGDRFEFASDKGAVRKYDQLTTKYRYDPRTKVHLVRAESLEPIPAIPTTVEEPEAGTFFLAKLRLSQVAASVATRANKALRGQRLAAGNAQTAEDYEDIAAQAIVAATLIRMRA